MRGWLLSVLLLASPAWAADTTDAASAAGSGRDELSRMNAASRAWDRYAELSAKDDPAVGELLAAAGLRHYGFLRDVARFGSADQVRRLPTPDRALVYCLRASKDDDDLAALDDRAAAQFVFASHWAGVSRQENGALPRLTHVTLLDATRAVGELAPPTGVRFQFGPELAFEEGRWKVLPQSLTFDEAQSIAQIIAQSGMTEAQMMQTIVARLLRSDEAPNLAVLDRPLNDDAGRRSRLNDAWPDYMQFIRNRIRAVEVKADAGDGFAQYIYGGLLYGGEAAEMVKPDKARGLAYLEKASDNGNAQAAWGAAGGLLADDLASGKVLSPVRLKRALPHVRRAAEGGIPLAMSAMGDFYFNGAGGLARDCRAAEEWQARAEDAGASEARNNRVWSLAVCPIAEQRDPARALMLAEAMIGRADELSAAHLDTVAAVYAANGRFTEAADFQQRAITALPKDEEATRRRMKERLRDYQAGRAWTQSYSVFDFAQ